MKPHLEKIRQLVALISGAESIKAAILRECGRAETVNPRACLRCEGHGTVRDYYNNAGNYTVHHCPVCDGRGWEKI